jgi:hypothetical protein
MLHNFSCCADRQFFPHFSFISLIFRSSCSLQTLSLHNFQISENNFIECLQAIPSLQNLSLTNMITPKILRMLNPCVSNAGPSNNLLPNLRTIECSGSLDPFGTDFSALVSLLRSRWANRGLAPFNHSETVSIARLRVQSGKFEAIGTGVPDAHTLAQLLQLVEEGMNVVLSTTAGYWVY